MSSPLSPDDWRRLEPLLDAALDGGLLRRQAILDDLSGGDPARRTELEEMIADCERPYPLLEETAAGRFGALFQDLEPVPAFLTERYQVVREAGRGGMAIVYLARDLKHGRDVAVKVVRPELAASLGRARFLREIEIAARLRHPHIVPLYDSGQVAAGHPGLEQDEPEAIGALYYVMPYEPGHSLRERLARDGPLAIADAVMIVRDVCDALAHAHSHGIIHRDIKPDNILLSGRHAMVADFGVAQAVTEATPQANAGTMSTALGTPGYMAPEQVKGDSKIDHRADIYAVGVLAYELLAGRPPFGGEAASLSGHRSDVPLAIVAFITKCLEKQPGDRWQSAEEMLDHLEHVLRGNPKPGPSIRRVGYSIVGGLLALAAVAGILLTRNRPTTSALELGLARQLTSEPGLEVQPSMSPDGKQVAYAAGHSLHMRIYVRSVADGTTTKLIADTTESQSMPRWSPDGKRILFLSNGAVFSAPASGGAARQEIPSSPGGAVNSATWSPAASEIAYVRGDSLFVSTLGTGESRAIASGDELHSCSWAPDGARLACVSGNHYYVTVGTVFGVGPMFGNLAPSRIVLIPAEGGAAVSITDGASLHQSPAWSRDGKTLYFVSNRQGPRDVYAIKVAGMTPSDGDPIRITTGMGAHSIEFSADGARVVYAAYSSNANVWAMSIPENPPASQTDAVAVTSGNQTVEGVRVSPDGKWVIYDSDLRGNSDVYRVPVTGGTPERLTSGPLDEFRGAVSPGGNELTYHSFHRGSRNMFLVPLGGGPVQQITSSNGHLSMANWSPDGNALILFDMVTSDVLLMRRDAKRRWGMPRTIARDGWRPEWSPDGRTVAFVSPADGRIGVAPADSGTQRDLYVPGPGDPLAELAVFAPDGRRLFFKSHDARGRASFWSMPLAGGRPQLLVRFDDPARASNRFEFASDGKRFYFTVEDRQSDIWIAEVARPD